jgi:hypothetical protein
MAENGCSISPQKPVIRELALLATTGNSVR